MTSLQSPNGAVASAPAPERQPDTLQEPEYRDARLPISSRVADLISRMTLLEKARQLDLYMGSSFVDRMRNDTMMASDAAFDETGVEALLGDAGVGAIHDLYPPNSDIPNRIQTWLLNNSRLGIPALFAEEALHGLCCPGNTAFPQVIGLASTWNPGLVGRVGAAVAAEMRASNIHFTFGPVLDVARDARWGRTEETFGEDPYLVSRMGVAIVRGLQGEALDSDHTVIAEPKHFAGHGSPEGGRNTAPLHAGPREMAETMLPPFEAAVIEGGALGIMCAYHEIDGIPCAASPDLLTGLLRGQWGFEGMVLSDLGAIRLLLDRHRVAADPADAVRQALSAGMDMQYYDFDHKVFEDAVVSSVENGLLDIAIVDQAVARILGLKFRLGLFENPFIDPALAGRVKRRSEHLALNLEAARESICLLKNEGGLLPLGKDLRRIAVVGPNAAQARFGDYSSTGDGKSISLLAGIRAAVSASTDVSYVDGTRGGSRAPLSVNWLETNHGGSGLLVQLYANADLIDPPLSTRIDPTIDYNWVATLPAAGLPVDRFSARWTGILAPERTVSGTLSIPPQDAMRVWLDGDLVLDSWDGASALQAPLTLHEGKRYALKVEYRKMGGGSKVIVGWSDDAGSVADAVAIAREADVVIAALGEHSGISGEGIDRSDISLPEDQMELLRAVHATGTPVVVILMNGRPLTIEWAAGNAPAVVEAWYPAEFGGRALADVLFGDYNPAGRLPVSFPKSVGQLPVTYDRKPSSATGYVDMDWRPLFSFGHGLSYTEFTYSGLTVTRDGTSPYNVGVSVVVENTGARDGDEVVQLYVRDVLASVTTPVRALKAFERIHLKAGERRTVAFALGERDLTLIDREMKRVVEPGSFEVYVGGSSEAALKAEFRIL